MMAHGTPDWWGASPKSTTFAVQDDAELAARLFSPNTFDRRGDTILMDNFDNGVGGWTLFGAGAGPGLALANAALSRSPPLSIKLTSDGSVGDVLHIFRGVHYPVDSRMGFEFSFNMDGQSCLIRGKMTLYDGTNRRDYGWQYTSASGVLARLNSGNTYTTIDTLTPIGWADGAFTPTKLVIDESVEEYVRLIFGNTEYSITGVGPYETADATAPQLRVVMTYECVGAVVGGAHYDDAIITQNEP